MSLDIILGLAIGAAVACAIFVFIQKRRDDKTLENKLEQHLTEMFPRVLQAANEHLLSTANEKLGSVSKQILIDLDNKRESISKMVEEVQKELRNTDRNSQSMMQQIKDSQKFTEELRQTTEGLKKVLTNNQLRGQFGEQVAEDLLKMAGFVRGVDFEYNQAQASSPTRPDFSIYLPDKTKVNVDVKFPYANLQRATETDDPVIKQQFMKAFARDVKEKINQITTRDYINPEEKTVDFVILFVPNEMIFSYIYDKFNDVWHEALEKKVVLAGPFSFTAILRMIRQAYDNFRYQKNIHLMVGYIKEFEKQFELYNQEFAKLGSQMETTMNTFHKVDSTRSRQLTRVIEKIKIESGKESEIALLE